VLPARFARWFALPSQTSILPSPRGVGLQKDIDEVEPGPANLTEQDDKRICAFMDQSASRAYALH
jgi:hypothetical protein